MANAPFGRMSRNRTSRRYEPFDSVESEIVDQPHRNWRSSINKVFATENIFVCQAIAILDEQASGELISQVLDEDKHAIARSIGRLGRAGMLNGLRFRDPAVRRHILSRTSPEIRAWLNHRIAEALHRQDASPITVAQYLVRAGYARFPDALTVLRFAADSALLHGDPESAIQFLELAYRTSTSDDDRTSIAATLVAMEWRFNPSVTTRNFSRVWATVHSGRLPPAHLSALVVQLLWHGRSEDALVALRQLHERDDCPASDLEFLWTWLEYTYPELPLSITGVSPVDTGHRARHSLNDQATEVLSGMKSGALEEEAHSAAQRILNHHRLDIATVEALIIAVEGLIHFGNLIGAAAWCDTLEAEAVARRAPTWQAMFAALRAEIFLRQGDMTQAAQYGLRALNLVPAKRLGTRVGRPLACLVRGLTASAQYDEARRQLERPVPDALFESRYGLLYLHSRGHYHLAIGDVDAALRDFQRCGETMRKWQLDLPQQVAWRNDMAEAYLTMHASAKAHEYLSEHLRLLDRTTEQHPTRGVSLRLMAMTATGRPRLRMLHAAAEIARDHDDKLELSRTLSELGTAYTALGQVRRARSLHRTSARLIKEISAATATAPAPDSGGTARENRSGTEKLSPAELRVAELAANGMRNKDIADTLAITISTVEQHLTQVYRKLQIRRRTELRFLLHPPAPEHNDKDFSL